MQFAKVIAGVGGARRVGDGVEGRGGGEERRREKRWGRWPMERDKPTDKYYVHNEFTHVRLVQRKTSWQSEAPTRRRIWQTPSFAPVSIITIPAYQAVYQWVVLGQEQKNHLRPRVSIHLGQPEEVLVLERRSKPSSLARSWLSLREQCKQIKERRKGRRGIPLETQTVHASKGESLEKFPRETSNNR